MHVHVCVYVYPDIMNEIMNTHVYYGIIKHILVHL